MCAGGGSDCGVMWAGQYSCVSTVDSAPHKNLYVALHSLLRSVVLTSSSRYYRRFDPAKVLDPSIGADNKRGCVGFRFVAKDVSNLRPFVSFLEPM